MALQSSGPISMNDINVELGNAGTTTISLNDSTVRALAGISSGAISLYDFYGKSNIVAESGYQVTEILSTHGITNAFALDSANNVYALNSNYQTGSFVIVKTNTNGGSVWTKKITLSGITNLYYTNAFDIKVDTSGNIYVIANLRINSNYLSAYNLGLVVKLNSSASVTWSKTIYSTSSGNAAQGWALSSFDVNNSTGDVYLAGVAWSSGAYTVYPHVMMAKLDSSGSLQWIKSQNVGTTSFGYFGLRPETYVACKLSSSGNVYYHGSVVNGFRAGLDSSGNFIWGPYGTASGGNIAMDNANGQYYSFDGQYVTKTNLSTGALTRVSLFSPKNPASYAQYATDVSGRGYNIAYNPSTGDIYYFYSTTALRTNAGGGYLQVITKANVSNFGTSGLAWTKAWGPNTISPALSTAYPSGITGPSGGLNTIVNSDLSFTSGGNLVVGGTGNSTTYLYSTSIYMGQILKLPTDSTTINTFNGNYGSYFTVDDPNSPYASGDTATALSSTLSNSTYSASPISESSWTTVSSVSTSVSTVTVTLTNTAITANTSRIVVAPPTTGSSSSIHRTWYTGNKKYHIIWPSAGSTVTGTSLNISTVPSGKSWNWLIVGPGAGGANGTADGGNGGNGGAGGQVVTGSSSSAGNQTGINVGATSSGTSTVGFGSTATYAVNTGGTGGSSGSPTGASTTNGTVSSLIGLSLAYGTGGGGGGVGQGTSYGPGDGGSTIVSAQKNVELASAGGLPTNNNGGGGGGWSSDGSNGGYSTSYEGNFVSGGYPWAAGHGGGGGGGGGAQNPDDPEAPPAGNGGGGGLGMNGMVIVSYDYNP